MPAGTIRGGIRIKYKENKIKQKNFIFHQYWGIGKYINLAPEFQIKSWILKYSAEIHVHKFTFENSSKFPRYIFQFLGDMFMKASPGKFCFQQTYRLP